MHSAKNAKQMPKYNVANKVYDMMEISTFGEVACSGIHPKFLFRLHPSQTSLILYKFDASLTGHKSAPFWWMSQPKFPRLLMLIIYCNSVLDLANITDMNLEYEKA